MSVRVRFAPSPTGYLHIGGLRTALYNFLFARHHQGSFILRIEDTDRTRYVENATENLINSLRWAGINYDEGPGTAGMFGPYIQSERLTAYRRYALELVENGNAYYAFDTPEEIEAMRTAQRDAKSDFKYERMKMKNQLTLGDAETKMLIDQGVPYVIRLKIPEGEVVFNDIIRGEVRVNCRDIDDQVLMKSDGFPTYHLANVVDDHLMKITHVIRGEEWLPSTPKHILLYDAFGWDKPGFAHLPLLLNPDKTKLSKRQGDVAVEDYIAKGYFPEAIVNFVALLGWNPSSDREIYSIGELIGQFDITKVNKAGAVFDLDKLNWMNAGYLRNMTDDALAVLFAEELTGRGINFGSLERLEKIVSLLKERVITVKEMPDFGDYFFAPPEYYEREYVDKSWSNEKIAIFEPVAHILRSEDDYSHDNLFPKVKDYCKSAGIKINDIMLPLRVMITGKTFGAGMFEIMELIGKDECLLRIERFLGLAKSGSLVNYLKDIPKHQLQISGQKK